MSHSTFCYDTSDTPSTTAEPSSPVDPVPEDLDIHEKIMSNLRSKPHLKEMFRFVEENSRKMRAMSQDVQ